MSNYWTLHWTFIIIHPQHHLFKLDYFQIFYHLPNDQQPNGLSRVSCWVSGKQFMVLLTCCVQLYIKQCFPYNWTVDLFIYGKNDTTNPLQLTEHNWPLHLVIKTIITHNRYNSSKGQTVKVIFVMLDATKLQSYTPVLHTTSRSSVCRV